MSTLHKALRDEWYTWERLGRGELVWDRPVHPEPYFVPFFGHGAFIESPSAVDDGRKESFLGSLLKRKPMPPPVPPARADPLEAIRSGIALPFLEDSREELLEGLWHLPANLRWQPSAFEPFLYALGAANQPVCLEFLASGEAVEVQWVISLDDEREFRDALHQLPFPPNVEWRQGYLESILLEKELPSLWCRDLALEREFVFPIRRDFGSDPYGDILASLNGLPEDLLALVQIVFEPCVNRWADSLWRLVTGDDGKPFFANGADFLHATKSKCAKPLHAATVRLAVLGTNREEIESNARRIARSFACYEDQNAFVLADDYERSWEETLLDLAARRSKRSGMILNGDELLGLIHPPSSGAGAPGLKRQSRTTWPAPQTCRENFDFALGYNEHGSNWSECGLSTVERLRHMHVLGASGTGKSTFLLSSILQDLEAGHGLALLDPHGDLVEAVLDRLPEERIHDVVLFDPSDAEWPVGFNILRAHSDIERNLLASDFVAIFERLSSSWGDQMTAVLGNAALAFLESREGGTLLDLKRFLVDKEFRARFLPTVRDPEVRYFWTNEFPILRGTTQASLLTRLNGFLRHRIIRNMVAQKGERFDVGRMMDEGKIILAPLSQGLIGQENSWLLGSLLVSRFHQAAISRQAIEESKRRPFFLYLDEAHNFVTPSIASILSGARKYGLGLVLAHQEIDQFPSRESGILGAILTNCHSRVYFRLGDRDAKRLEEGFGHFEATDFSRLKVGEAICRIGGSDSDFSLDTCPAIEPPTGFEIRRQRAINHSRATYATPRESVEPAEDDGEGPGPPLTFPVDPPPTSPRRPTSPSVLPVTPRPAEPPPRSAAGPPPTPGPTAESPPIPPVVDEPPAPPAKPSRSPGRGSTRHRFIQRLIEQHGRGIGLGADIEGGRAQGQGAADVLLRGNGVKIAFEIAHRSSVGQEVQNIEKAIAAEIPEIVVVSEDAKHLADVREAVRTKIDPTNLARVSFLPFSELGDYFARLGARLASKEGSSRGYKVKVNFTAPEGDVRERKADEIHRAAAEGKKPEDQKED